MQLQSLSADDIASAAVSASASMWNICEQLCAHIENKFIFVLE